MCIIYQNFIIKVSEQQHETDIQGMIQSFNTYAKMRHLDIGVPLYVVHLDEEQLVFEVFD